MVGTPARRVAGPGLNDELEVLASSDPAWALTDGYIGSVYRARGAQRGVGAALVLMTLDTLITFAGETGTIGHAHYTVWYAIAYVLLSMPQELYQYFPMIALLGTMFGLGMLASHSELIAMRAAGLSIVRITYAVLKTGSFWRRLSFLSVKLSHRRPSNMRNSNVFRRWSKKSV